MSKENLSRGNLSESAQSQLNQFKEYAISHPHLAQVDMLLMSAIREPALLCSCPGLWTFWCGEDDDDSANYPTVKWK